jgi:glycosyltransferase involved in cell wall biosynthesis
VSPLISVVVTAANQALHIGPALDSVLTQTSAPGEIIVVDDGSTDETPAAIAPYRDRIVYIRQPNQGVARSRNTGIRAAHGELLAFLDGDDLWEPDKLAVQALAAQGHPKSGLIAVNGIQFTEARVARESLFPAQIARLFESGEESVSLDASEFSCTRTSSDDFSSHDPGLGHPERRALRSPPLSSTTGTSTSESPSGIP